jgi:hypothetical protein
VHNIIIVISINQKDEIEENTGLTIKREIISSIFFLKRINIDRGMIEYQSI